MSETTETVVMVETANNTAVAVEDPKSEKDFLNLIPRALNAEGMKEALLKKPVAVEPLKTAINVAESDERKCDKSALQDWFARKDIEPLYNDVLTNIGKARWSLEKLVRRNIRDAVLEKAHARTTAFLAWVKDTRIINPATVRNMYIVLGFHFEGSQCIGIPANYTEVNDKIHSIMRDVNAVKKAKNTLAVSMFDVVKKAESTPRKEYSPIDQLKKDIKGNLTRAGAELGLLVEKKDKTASQIERMGVLENAVTLLKLLDSNFEGCLSTTVTNHVRL